MPLSHWGHLRSAASGIQMTEILSTGIPGGDEEADADMLSPRRTSMREAFVALSEHLEASHDQRALLELALAPVVRQA